MNGKIIIFRVKHHIGHKKTVEFCNKFYGCINKSNYGRYSYKRPGFIDKYPHIRLIRGVILVRSEHVDEFVKFLGQYSPEIYVRNVEFTNEDARKLGVKID